MSAFGGLILTNKGRNLQAKAQVGAQLNFTRIAIGDGDLDGTSILDLNALRHEVKSLSITKLKTMTGGKAVVGTTFSNQDITSGFYWRELGVFAQDPELGEILYCYGNSGANAEYIPAGGGPDTIEKSIDVVTIVGNTSSVTASIDQSLIYASQQDLTNIQNQIPTNISQLNNDVGYITQAPVQSVNGKIGKVTLTASDVGAVNKAGDYMTGSLTVPNLITQINIPSSSPPSAWPVGFVAGVVYNNGYPARYGTIFSYKGTSGNSCVQILQEWPGNDGGEAYLYIRSARDTGADVFGPWRKVWSENNDGTGSGLDADLLDGLHASSFVNKAGDTMTGRLIVPAGDSGGIAFPNDAFGGSGDTASITLQNPSGSENQELIIQVTNDATDIVHIKTPSDNGVKINNNTVWHAGNDGAGSGLDADMVDGKHASAFLTTSNLPNAFVVTLVSDMYSKDLGGVSNQIYYQTQFLFNSIYATGKSTYIEIVGNSKNSSYTAYFTLNDITAGKTILTLSTNSTTPVRLRSTAISIPDGHVIALGGYSRTNFYIYQARLIIM